MKQEIDNLNEMIRKFKSLDCVKQHQEVKSLVTIIEIQQILIGSLYRKVDRILEQTGEAILR
jgi:hypothetical protein